MSLLNALAGTFGSLIPTLGGRFASTGGTIFSTENTWTALQTFAAGIANTGRYTVPAVTAGRGPFALDFAENVYSTIHDPTIAFGYNLTATGTLIQAGENALALGIEGHYYDGFSNKMEVYLQYNSANNLTQVRPLFFQLDKTTNRVTYALIQGNPLYIQDDLGNASIIAFPSFVTVNGLMGHDTTLAVASVTGRTSVINLGYNGLQGRATMYPTVNSWQFNLGSQAAIFNLFDTPHGAAGQAASIGVVDNGAALTAAVNATYPLRAIVARGKLGQSVSILEIQKNDSTVLSRFDKNGYFMTAKNTVPADADLNTNEMSIWFDNTAGAAKLMIKAKDSGGAVRTGSVALA